MADTATTDRDERRAALEAFAAPAPKTLDMPSALPAGAPSERTFGAVAVAVQRDEARVLQKLKTLSAAAGSDWYYRFPVKKKDGGTDWIEGPSIKLANDLARLYGNCDVDVRMFDLGDSWLFYARFTDFETGFSLTRPFQQRKSQRAMKTDADRQLDIAFQIGASKAIRNVVVNALQTFADFAFEEAKGALVEKIGKDIGRWRDRTLQGLEAQKIDVRRAEKVIGRAAGDWLAADVARVIAMMKAVADGMATWDETFPPIEEAKAETNAGGKPAGLDDFAAEKVDPSTGEIQDSAASEAVNEAPANGPAAAPKGAEGAAPHQGPQASGAQLSPSAAPGAASSDREHFLSIGRRAFERGMTRKACVPGEYRGKPEATAVIVEGFDAATKDAEG